jgi:hypothetical protein
MKNVHSGSFGFPKSNWICRLHEIIPVGSMLTNVVAHIFRWRPTVSRTVNYSVIARKQLSLDRSFAGTVRGTWCDNDLFRTNKPSDIYGVVQDYNNYDPGGGLLYVVFDPNGVDPGPTNLPRFENPPRDLNLYTTDRIAALCRLIRAKNILEWRDMLFDANGMPYVSIHTFDG